MNFDKWARDLADQLREKEQKVEIKPEDLYTHKDLMRGEYGKVTTDGKEINSAADKYKGQAGVLQTELDKKAPLQTPINLRGTTEREMNMSSRMKTFDEIREQWGEYMNDRLAVGDLYRTTHENCGQFMIDCYNNGIICQIDSIDSTFVTLVRVE